MAKIKVSQSMIDSIKKLGMTEALKLAGKNGTPAGGMASEFQEGVRRMYGDRRLAQAKAKTTPAAKSADAARAGVTKPASKAAIKSVSTKAPKSKPESLGSKAAKAAGMAAGVGLLVASKGKAAKVAAKLAPGLGAVSKSTLGKAILGGPEVSSSFKVGAKGAFGKTTSAAAKAGKVGTKSEYAMKSTQAKAAKEMTALASRGKLGTKAEYATKAAESKAAKEMTALAAKKSASKPAVKVPSKKALITASAASTTTTKRKK